MPTEEETANQIAALESTIVKIKADRAQLQEWLELHQEVIHKFLVLAIEEEDAEIVCIQTLLAIGNTIPLEARGKSFDPSYKVPAAVKEEIDAWMPTD